MFEGMLQTLVLVGAGVFFLSIAARWVARRRRSLAQRALGPLFQLNENPHLETWARSRLELRVQETIRALARQQDTQAPARHQALVDALYLGRNKTEEIFLQPTGEVILRDGEQLRYASPGHRLLLLRRAAAGQPVLTQLLPTTPAGAIDCPDCDGTGRRRGRLASRWCPRCGALGWLPANCAAP